MSQNQLLDPLLDACRDNDTFFIKNWLKNNPGANLNFDINSWTPIFAACYEDGGEALKLLIEHGADVNYKNSQQDYALTYAAKRKSGKCLDILIKNGANINNQNQDGNTALLGAILMNAFLNAFKLSNSGALGFISNDNQNSAIKTIFTFERETLRNIDRLGEGDYECIQKIFIKILDTQKIIMSNEDYTELLTSHMNWENELRQGYKRKEGFCLNYLTSFIEKMNLEKDMEPIQLGISTSLVSKI